jgi:septum formation protein
MKLILASNSPRRRDLLSLTDWNFQVIPAEVNEDPHPGESPSNYVLRLAESKARAVVAQRNEADFVVAADTTVVDSANGGDVEILGKPLDAADAQRMLQQLRGRTHQVLTAIAVLHKDQFRTDLCCTDVPMREYNDTEMRIYIESGDPLDKAGAYAIQHADFHPVENLTGCYANVVGLPLCHLTRTMSQLGISPGVDMPAACQASLGYPCSIFDSILREAE